MYKLEQNVYSSSMTMPEISKLRTKVFYPNKQTRITKKEMTLLVFSLHKCILSLRSSVSLYSSYTFSFNFVFFLGFFSLSPPPFFLVFALHPLLFVYIFLCAFSASEQQKKTDFLFLFVAVVTDQKCSLIEWLSF